MIEYVTNILLILKTVFIDWIGMIIKAIFDFVTNLF